MTADELKEVVEQRMSDPAVLGRVVCNLRSAEPVEQRHHDGRAFSVVWQDDGDYWRCVIEEPGATRPLIQMDLHENATVRIETYEPCRVTVSPEENILCVTRYKS